MNINGDIVLGWALGVISSLLTGLFMFWLEGKRELRFDGDGYISITHTHRIYED